MNVIDNFIQNTLGIKPLLPQKRVDPIQAQIDKNSAENRQFFVAPAFDTSETPILKNPTFTGENSIVLNSQSSAMLFAANRDRKMLYVQNNTALDVQVAPHSFRAALGRYYTIPAGQERSFENWKGEVWVDFIGSDSGEVPDINQIVNGVQTNETV